MDIVHYENERLLPVCWGPEKHTDTETFVNTTDIPKVTCAHCLTVLKEQTEN